jgi:hypothetical protein
VFGSTVLIAEAASSDEMAMGGESVPGLAVSAGGTSLKLDPTALPRGERTDLSFRILDDEGRAVRDFEVSHEKRMHLIVVRRDTRGFQHLHPRMDADGRWTTPVTLPDAGGYRVFADFERDGEKVTLGSDLTVDGPVTWEPLPAASSTATTTSGYEVHLSGGESRAGGESELEFTVTRDGDPIRTEPYLGAGGHLVALREGDLGYLHTHPAGHGDGEASGHDAAVPFATEFPSEGRYRLFFQFKHDGRVHTAAFTREVAR